MRLATCSAAKVKYFDMRTAQSKASRMENKRSGEFWSAYKCVECGFYHVGHDHKKERRAVLRATRAPQGDAPKEGK